MFRLPTQSFLTIFFNKYLAISSINTKTCGSSSTHEDQDIKEEDCVNMDACDDGIKSFPPRPKEDIAETATRDNAQEFRTQQQIALVIACIGQSFYGSADVENESEIIFRDLTDLDSNGLIFLPGIVTTLCKRIVDLDNRNSLKSMKKH